MPTASPEEGYMSLLDWILSWFRSPPKPPIKPRPIVPPQPPPLVPQPPIPEPPLATMKLVDAEGWHPGPTVNGRPYAWGVPSEAEAFGTGFRFPIPPAGQGQWGYLIHRIPIGSLRGRKRIRMRFSIEVPPNHKVAPSDHAPSGAMIGLCLGVSHTNWTGNPNNGRLYSKAIRHPIEAGKDFELVFTLDGISWGGIQTAVTPAEVMATINSVIWIAITGGGGPTGRAHGFSTFEMEEGSVNGRPIIFPKTTGKLPAWLIVHDFTIE
jgi:hypothetical protein